jgi:hypothetical protein
MPKLSPAAVALLAFASPALTLALEHPTGERNADRRVCDVVYDQNDIVDVRAIVGVFPMSPLPTLRI